MTHEELTALREKIDASQGLKNLEQNLIADLMSQEERGGYGFDPLTILFVISVILQVINLCMKNRSAADIELDMANVGILPPRKLMRLKRRLNCLWVKHCSERGIEPGKKNLFFEAAIRSVKQCRRDDIAGIVQSSN